MTHRLVFPDTAFPLRQKQPRVEDKRHLVFIRELPCLCCRRHGPSEAAHIRSGNPDYDKPETGMGQKPSDCWTVPLCPDDHRLQHSGNEIEFWQAQGIDPFKVSIELYKVSGDHAAALAIIRNARSL